jgi:Domain of unknown function (DUF4359)
VDDNGSVLGGDAMRHWQLWGALGLGLLGLGGLLVGTNPSVEAFEAFTIDKVKTELCPQVPLGLAQDCPRLVDQNQTPLKEWIRKNTKSQNYGLFTQYETNLSVRELIPAGARPFLSFMPLPANYRLQSIGILGRFVIYGAKSEG